MKTSLTIVIPVYNEASRLQRAFDSLNSLRLPSPLKVNQVIFVNDGSKDESLKILRNAKLKFPKKIISYRHNLGKGYAVKRGMLASKSEFTLLTDADIATPLTEIDKFLPYIKAGLDVIIGTRKNGRSTVTVHQPFIRENMGKVFTALSRLILGVNVTDFTCGFKVFKKGAREAIFKRALVNRWGYDSEVLFLAHKLGFNMVERSVSWADQRNTKVRLLNDAVNSFKELLEIRFNYFSGKYKIVYNYPKREYNFS
ncbi:MAG: Glycosyl transferase, group 2 family [Candidatus Collierbacteria bacterium GW2011_GWF2_44_15]|uniref:Glycosyl transferase, group 2 family n=4 Tax=Candidatus Collieribacteriota TaxID=1752725 RepID=A0A0G1HHB0_9BACT|nr:MAG: Glycosyl transferase, group 2 family [Candidatus Collierbacteria bacterium GW2011_GWA1_44_12]KKT39187.1 MAG: Glycosyl transferase, group 2 family [Candidatus Collierbacteria bacterium GW2011_GWF1_44_12]KKT45933.1 MAG: Glycosyl transferase, group 2 family [Candidatus Collierbacteria bacterium GW2011_GWF2_44_15]KKT96704.1 MAG: Glycosyl transferase, group 2 family [Candidatus Collierbacteria bacterium GW2011_GWC2_45_15]